MEQRSSDLILSLSECSQDSALTIITRAAGLLCLQQGTPGMVTCRERCLQGATGLGLVSQSDMGHKGGL